MPSAPARRASLLSKLNAPAFHLSAFHLLPFTGAHVGVALLPPPDKLKQKKKKEDKDKKEGKQKEKDGGRAGGADGASPSSPRGMGGSGTAQGRQGQGAHGQVQAHGHGAAHAAAAAVPGEPPKNRPGTAMLNQMRARGQRSEWGC